MKGSSRWLRPLDEKDFAKQNRRPVNPAKPGSTISALRTEESGCRKDFMDRLSGLLRKEKIAFLFLSHPFYKDTERN